MAFPKKYELAWLACFLDSEGSIIASKKGDFRCAFANSDPDMLEFAQRVLDKLGVRHRVYKKNKVNRQVYQILILDKTSLVRTLTAMLPYLLRLAKKAKLVIKYCKLRSLRSGYNAKKTQAEKHIAALVRAA